MESNSVMNNVLILGAGPLQLPAIKTAKELDFTVYCCDYDPSAIGFKYADSFKTISTMDEEAVLNYATEINADYVITSASDGPVRTAALVSEQLGLPVSIAYDDSKAATYKDLMRERLDSFNIPMPKYSICNSFDEFSAALKAFSYYCIVKPADSAASRGVKLVNSTERLNEETLFNETLAYSNKKTVMVEERVIGPEISVEAITINKKTEIITLTDKIKTEPPYFVEIGHSEPSKLPDAIQKQIKSLTKRVIKAVGIINGPSHTEIILTKDGPKVIETAARLGGDFITAKLVPLSTGVDLAEESIKLALGSSSSFEKTKKAASAIFFLTTTTPGYITSIEIDENIKEAEGLVEYSIYKSVGDYIDTPHSSNDRIGHIICSTKIEGDALRLAQKAASYVHYNIKADSDNE